MRQVKFILNGNHRECISMAISLQPSERNMNHHKVDFRDNQKSCPDSEKASPAAETAGKSRYLSGKAYYNRPETRPTTIDMM